MFSVVIVDDEHAIREGLRKLINWESLDFTVSGTASDALGAIELIAQIRPDLVITDIKMPQMDGLEMIRRLQQNNYNGCFIIISGYADFEYARNAIRYGVKSYLLKPVDQRALAGEVYALREDLQKKERSEFGGPISSKMNREKLLELFLNGRISSEEVIREIPNIGFDITGRHYRVILMQYQPPESLVQQELNYLLEKYSRQNGCTLLYCSERNASMLNTNKNTPSPDWLYALRNQATHELRINISVSVGIQTDSFSGLNESFATAKKAMEDLFLYGYQGVVYALENKKEPSRQEQPPTQDIAEKLMFAIQCESNFHIGQFLDQYWIQPFIDMQTGEMDIKAKTIGLFVLLVDRLCAAWPEIDPALYGRQEFIESIYFYDSICELGDALKAHVINISDVLTRLQPEDVMKKVLQYIEHNYMRSITLDSLSRAMHYNRNYFGRKFRNYTGEHFNVYLDKLRIHKAQELLKSGCKISQAAQQVGFTDTDYFNAKFHKYVHISPSAYRTDVAK